MVFFEHLLSQFEGESLGGHMNNITWLHISDLHLSNHDLRPSQAFDSDIVLQKLLEDIEAYAQSKSLQPNFIIVSGDIAFSSKPEEYNLARGFFDRLLEITHLSKDRLFIVPGNHDVDRKLITPGASLIANGINSRESINEILANDADRALILQRFANYKQFIEEYMGNEILSFDNNKYYYVKPVNNVSGYNISILGLNSALLAGSDNDQSHLIVGDMQVRKAISEAGDANIRLAVMHHPIDWLQKFDQSNIKSLLHKNCEFVLQGHLHESSLEQVVAPGRFSTIIAAGACFEKRELHNSYNFVQLNPDSSKGKIHLRMYSDRDGGFWTNDTITYRDAKNGIYEFTLPAHISKLSVEGKLAEPQGSKDITKVVALKIIPLKPQPYFAHLFHLQANFTGRLDERKMLTNWFTSDKDPIFVLVAIGGMGKSSLSWYWLKNDIDPSLLEGIFWWSFYEGEASFTRFLDDAIIYASGKTINLVDTKSNYEKSRVLLSLLQQHKFLFVLDGFERQLWTYYDHKSNSYHEDLDEGITEARSCVDPYFGRFIRDLAACDPKTKILITSRMRLQDVEDDTGATLEGFNEKVLNSFNQDDAFRFMQAQGVTIGTRKEILDACEVYGCHPLSLRLLSRLIARNPKKPGDVSTAPGYDYKVYADLKARRHHIIEVAFNSLPEQLQKLLSEAAAFRSTIAYDSLSLFNDFGNDLEFEEALKDLVSRQISNVG